jgi:GNAT superfamily N-acetyltransferase
VLDDAGIALAATEDPAMRRPLAPVATHPRATAARPASTERDEPARVEACTAADATAILAIINEAAERYRGVIPADCFHDPYMSQAALRAEIAAGVLFSGIREEARLIAAMGVQRVKDVQLIRHAYVRPEAQGRGLGGMLLRHLTARPEPILIGTWAAASWAIGFYRKHGFELAAPAEARRLLHTYWTIPDRQAEVSVVLRQSRPTARDEG